ncbi:hypothetical protein FHX42_000904 [Saccharopolyspora lacisalsi]|uniref:DUF3054 domain-containing protein n=1 Tax=Halosaccharopolyspora lacisalsi TaxID=1000566 RepID=A0A839DW75_9PSEU|nr:DUF3054 domain-containing protein [Halosaccharopolyspora lacisalsi]MBA8823575.1 hypothetical protein [Halosaccharopolyspora lacisalsi]
MRWLWALIADLVVVLLFVLIGRGSHEEGNALVGVVATLWPFAVGTLVGWLVGRGPRHPVSVVPTGLVVWVATVVIGMVLRWATGSGTPVSFIVVTSVFLGVFMLGWRAVALAVRRFRRVRQG